MKILLDNHNEQVAQVVNICCERTGSDLAPYSMDEKDYDLVIKDYEDGDTISHFDVDKTLFLISKDDIIVGSKYTLSKPFSPKELINFIEEFAAKNVNTQIKAKMAQDFENVSSVIKEIENIDEKKDENSGNMGISLAPIDDSTEAEAPASEPAPKEDNSAKIAADEIISIMDNDDALASASDEAPKEEKTSEPVAQADTVGIAVNSADEATSEPANDKAPVEINMDEILLSLDETASKVGDETATDTSAQNFESLVDNFYNSDDDIPLSTLAENIDDDAPLSSVLENVADDASLSDLANNISDDMPLSEISLDDIDEDKPLSALADEISIDDIDDDMPLSEISLDDIDEDKPLSAFVESNEVAEVAEEPKEEAKEEAKEEVKEEEVKEEEPKEEVKEEIKEEPKVEVKEEAKEEDDSSDESDFGSMFSQMFDSGSDDESEDEVAKTDDKPIALATNDPIPLADDSAKGSEADAADDDDQEGGDDNLLFDNIFALDKEAEQTAQKSDEKVEEKVEAPKFDDLNLPKVASGIEFPDIKTSVDVSVEPNEQQTVSANVAAENKDEVVQVLEQERRFLSVDELKEQLRYDLEANIASVLEQFSGEENIQEALKDLKININISFEDK